MARQTRTGVHRLKTQEVFDRIAPAWYGVRHHTIFRDELEDLARKWQKGKLLNIGCAHGPDFLPFKANFDLYGVDISPEMIKQAKKYARKFSMNFNLSQADARDLPFDDHSFDYAIAIASLHHLEGPSEAVQALHELKRVLRPGGEAFITVWNRWQRRFWFKPRELQVPWKAGKETILRYYYLYSFPQLEKLVAASGFTIMKSSPESKYHFPIKYFSQNICLLLKNSAD